MRIIGFCNLKGGVGKTTACQNIAVGLAKLGKKIAVIDMDPQSNLSAGFGIMPSPSDPQVFDLLSGQASWDEVLVTKEEVDIIPSSLHLVMAELNNKGPLSQDTALRDAVSKIPSDRYDYILMDSPPQLGIFTRNVLTACSKIIVPMDGGFYSLLGLKLLESSLQVFRDRLNSELEIAGVLMTNYNPRLYIARQVFDDVKKNFSSAVFENYVRQNVSLVEAASMGMSIFAYDPKSKGAECYKAVTDEFLRKFEGEQELSPLQQIISSLPDPEQEQLESEISAQATAPEDKSQDFNPEAPSQALTSEDKSQDLKLEDPSQALTPEETSQDFNLEETTQAITPEESPQDFNPEQSAQEHSPEPEQPKPESVKIPDGPLGEVLSLLPEEKRKMWLDMLDPMQLIRRKLRINSLRDDFEDSDKSRYTFYILDETENNLWPVMLVEQIEEPLKCALKIDENDGYAEVYI